MADNSWWFNRAGAVAPVSNPGSAVPNYGLTYDIATSPVDDKEYQALADSIGTVLSRFGAVASPAPAYDPTLWDRAKGAASAVGDTAAGVVGAVDAAADKLGFDATIAGNLDELERLADEKDLEGWDRLQFIGKGDATKAAENLMDGTSGKVLEKVDTAIKYGSAGIMFASLSQEDEGFDKVGQRWAEAKEMAFQGGYNPGQAFMTLALDKETLDDAERMERIREHNSLFNFSALAFNVIAAWKADPTVLVGKAAGQVGNVQAGRLATKGRSAEVQRDILSQPNRDAAREAAKQYTGIPDRVRAGYGLSLFDKSVQLREAAKQMRFEDFKNLSPFQNSASGVPMAKLMKEAADNDGDWNLVFRASIGDATAVDEIVTLRSELADKLEAVEARSLPSLERNLERVQARYEKRIAEQGRDMDAGLEITRYGDWLLDNDFQTLRADVDTAKARLEGYQTYESFLQRALPGLDVDAGTVNNRAANSIFGNLEQVAVGNNPLKKAGRATRSSLYELGGKVSTFAHDDYSAVSRVFRAPAKPFLKRTGVVNLNDVDEGAGAIQSYLDQIVYVTGRNNPQARDSILERWAGSTTDIERKDVVDELERQGIKMLGAKYGLDPEDMTRIATDLQVKRRSTWAKMSDGTMYSTVKVNGKPVQMLDVMDDNGDILDRVKMPMDPSELPNWRPLTNLTDMDHTLRQNRDLFQELGKARKAGLLTGRKADELYNMVGESLNSLWKPLALISLRWPARVVADESFRIMLMMGVLPHMKAWGEGVRNTVYNQGVMRPREWWQGREVRTGSLVEDSLRAMQHQFDPYDGRAAVNPTGAVPARALDLDQVDRKRYARLNSEVSRRRAETRSLAYYKGAAKTKWQQQWDDRLAAIENGLKGGDPWRNRTMSLSDLKAIAMENRIDPDSPEMRALVDDIAANGIKRPLQVEEFPDGSRTLTDGHHRLIAAEKAGIAEVPVRVYDPTEEGRRAANRALTSRGPDAPGKAVASRGFFFDPINGRAANKGFAVSTYPGRLKTFGAKPTAKEMNFFVETHSDLLAIKRNRVAVWLDKDTGRWHMDVVKVAKTRDDAMQLATEAEAPDFFDIQDGFTRYVADEDPMGHRAGAAQAFGRGGFDDVTVETVNLPEVEAAAPKRGVGFGKRKWRSKDGREVESEGIYGTDARDPNIYYSATSSQGAFQGLLGGHTRGLGQDRAKRTVRGYKAHQPDLEDPKGAANKEWGEAWSYYVNNHIRMSPIWRRMLDGQSDEQIEKWLMSRAGREVRTRMGPRGMNVHKWVADMRAIYDHTLPTPDSRLRVKQAPVNADEVDEVLPLEYRNDVHGQAIELAEGTHSFQQAWFGFVDKAYKMLGSMPTDALVRHPFAANVYDLRMKNYLASIPADQITDKVVAAAEASARAFAVKQTRRLLYNIADEVEGVHMLRFLSPFFQAQLEVMERYAHIWTRKPESLARTLLAFNATQETSIPGIYEVVDKDGKPAKGGYDHDNQVVLQVTPFMRKIAKHIPGLEGALDNAGSLKIPVASMNLILQGEKPYLPSAGPLVAVPVSEFYFRDRPWESESFVYEWLFPFGTPDGKTMLDRTGKSLSPAWLRRLTTVMTNDFNDSAYANRANIIYQDMMLAYQNGKRDKPPTEEEALEATKNEYMLRVFSSFALPVPVTPQSPNQFWLDQGRAYRDKYGIDADEKFYEDFGPDAFAYFVESSKSTNGLAPTSKQAKGYVANKKLIDQAPDLAGVLAGPLGYRGEFNDAVYQWQLENRRSPLSKSNMREIKDPAERIKDVQVDRGWIEYGKLASAVDAELRRRGLTSLENNGAEDLKYWRDQEVEGIVSRNPAFADAYGSRQQRMGGWLQQAYAVSFDKALDGRTDIEGLRAYLVSRAKMQEALQERQAAGIVESDSLSATENADLKAAWDSYVGELTGRNLLFSEIYHRYLEQDDLSVYVPGG